MQQARGESNIVVHLTFSLYGSSCKYVFFSLILVTLLSLSIYWHPKSRMGSKVIDWERKEENITKKEWIPWTKEHKTCKIWDYYTRLCEKCSIFWSLSMMVLSSPLSPGTRQWSKWIFLHIPLESWSWQAALLFLCCPQICHRKQPSTHSGTPPHSLQPTSQTTLKLLPSCPHFPDNPQITSLLPHFTDNPQITYQLSPPPW